MLLALTSCAGSSTPGAAPPSPKSLYTVTAIVMQKPGEAPHACAGVPLPYPPIGCGGPDVQGLNLAALHGVERYSNGVLAARHLRLVGRWNGHALVLTQPPELRSVKDATRLPECVQDGTEVVTPKMQSILADHELLKSHGIEPILLAPCRGAVFIVIPVADQESVKFLTDRYGPLNVAGWLQPIS